ncbi:MAG: dTDP-4-dehydrorhamnose reductase [Crocinitomicaceae bacterium TMED114]|nr:MAG: dTDP-4-dehydrorhamnose reductase [Crocinitomicaceae bacterium TMED114]
MRVMITGTTGQLGGRLMSLQGEAAQRGWTLLGCSRSDWDLAQPEEAASVVDRFQPDAVIHCAAYTAVDDAEDHADLAHRLNAEAPARLAEACAQLDIRLIHISTDYVFDGTATTPIPASAPTAPIGVYGASKLAGEQAVLRACPKASIVRVSWLYDREGHNFLNTMLRLAESHPRLTVVDDQVGCPTHAGHLAEDLLDWLDLQARDAGQTAGVHHYGHEGATTWHGFATAILAERAPEVEVAPVPSSAYPTKARRPAYSKLDERAFFRVLGRKSVGWKAALISCLRAKFPNTTSTSRNETP